MDLKELFELQYEFDSFVVEKHHLEKKSLLDKKIIALDVELSELANELRFFKYWSTKPMNRRKALEEYVDGLHFFLSIGNDLGVTPVHDYIEDETDICTIYTKLKGWTLNINGAWQWYIAFGWFKTLGVALGFTEQEIYYQYLDKHKQNYERQLVGY